MAFNTMYERNLIPMKQKFNELEYTKKEKKLENYQCCCCSLLHKLLKELGIMAQGVQGFELE